MEWWRRFFLAVDRKDISDLGDWFSTDLELQFGNWPRVMGKDAALVVLEQFFGSIDGLSHQLIGAVSQEARIVVESIVTYRRLDGSSVSLPAATLLERDGERIKHLRIYVDQSPLFAPAAA